MRSAGGWGRLLGALLLVGGAAFTDGAVEHRWGGAVLVGVAVLGAALLVADRVEVAPRDRLARAGVWLLSCVVVAQALPWPEAVRALVAPGQHAWLGRVRGPELGEGPAMDAWTEALASYDVDASIDAATRWTYEVPLAAADAGYVAGAMDPRGFAWTVAWFGAAGLLYLLGREAGRSERRLRVLAVVLLVYGVVEALWGIAERDGGRTGLAVRSAYLGSATGTFVNRGHFGAFLLLAVGAGWGLAASLFPLLPDEVRRHMQRPRRSSQPPGLLEASGDRIPRLAVLAIAASVLAMGLVASRSRGPIVALAGVGIAVGAWSWWRRAERWHLGLALALPSVGVAMATAAWGPRGAIGRFMGALSSEDVSLAARASLWRESLAAWWDAPLLGHGFGAWNTAWLLHERGAHLYAYGHAHSEPVEWSVEGGALGVVAAACLAAAWVRTTVRGLHRVDAPGLRSSLAIGLSVGVVGVAVQSLADFPLRIPGVLVAWALCAGAVHGALEEPSGPGAVETPGTRWRIALGGVALVVGVVGAVLARADALRTDSRAERVGEVHPVWYGPVDEGAARSAVATAPLDAWTHTALARALARRSDAMWVAGTGTPERLAWAAEQALTRAAVLRPRDPRLELASAQVLLRLGAHAPFREAWRARAVERLSRAVALDSWRAEQAFALAEGARPEQLAAIGDTGSHHDPRARARVLLHLGRALERAGDPVGALAALERAVVDDPDLGPAHFARGTLLRARGDSVGAEAAFRGLLGARDRPRGMEAWALAYLGEFDAARLRFGEVLAQDARNRWALEGLAHVARALGDAAGEAAALRRVVALAPDDAAAKAALEAVEGRKRGRGR